MIDLFISYKREDQGKAKCLAEALEAKGWSVWWDPKLQAGEHFDTVIEKALQDARCVIVLWSARALQSQYVKDEASYALKLGKLVPITIEKVEPPFRFQSLHTLDLSDWDASERYPAFRRLVEDLSARLGAAPPPREKSPARAERDQLAEAAALVEHVKRTFDRRDALFRIELEDPEAESLRRRALAGDVDAAFQLGVLHRSGKGVPKDLSVAYDWLHSAAIGGHPGAKALLRKIDEGKV